VREEEEGAGIEFGTSAQEYSAMVEDLHGQAVSTATTSLAKADV
jgi:hypothetical protein